MKKLTGYYEHTIKQPNFLGNGGKYEWRECEILGTNPSRLTTLIRNKKGEIFEVNTVYYNNQSKPIVCFNLSHHNNSSDNYHTMYGIGATH